MIPKFHLWPTILRMAIPLVIAMLSQTAINILDTVMVSWLDPSYSVAGQSALAFSTPLLWLFGGFLSAIGVGTLAIVARRQGEQNYKRAGAALSNAVLIAVISALLVGMTAYIFVPKIFRILIDNDAVLAFGVPYARYRMLGILSMVLTAAIKSFFDGTSKTYVHMVAAIVMNIANIVLNYVCIFGFGPLPALYVAGAGLASLISTYIGLAVMLSWTLLPSIRKQYKLYRLRDLHYGTMWKIIRVSVPSGVANIFVMSGFLIFFKIIGILDEASVKTLIHSISAYAGEHFSLWFSKQNNFIDQNVGLTALWTTDLPSSILAAKAPVYSSSTNLLVSIMSVAFMSAMAFGTATASLVSQSLGKKDPNLAESYAYESARLAFVIYLLLGIFAFVFAEDIVRLLSDVDEVVEVATSILRLMSISVPIIACALIFAQSLFGAGNTRFVMIVEGLLHFICLIPVSYLAGIVLDLGILGMWSAVILYASALALIMFIKLKSGTWKRIEL